MRILELIENLLAAHKSLACQIPDGSPERVSDLIKLTRFILKLQRRYEEDILMEEFLLRECECEDEDE
jgi:hypothetical protein